jgi:hypothetical protein
MLLHCTFVRPGTSPEITAQFLSPYVDTAHFNFLSSSTVQFLARTVVGLLLGPRGLRHLSLHCLFVRPGTSAAIDNQFLSPSVRIAFFNCFCLHLLSIYPYVASQSCFWRPRYHSICHNTAFSFYPEQAWRFSPNSYHIALGQNPSTSCLRQRSISRQVPSLGRCYRPS